VAPLESSLTQRIGYDDGLTGGDDRLMREGPVRRRPGAGRALSSLSEAPIGPPLA